MLLLAAFACILRPTNILIWICLTFLTVGYPGPVRPAERTIFLKFGVACGCFALICSAVADRFYYKTWTLPPLRFLHYNLAQSLSRYYGVNRANYYFSEGIPLLLTGFLPFALAGLWHLLVFGKPSARQVISGRRSGIALQELVPQCLAITIVFVVVTLSLISHKEVRFVYPLLPMLHVIAAPSLASYSQRFSLSRFPQRSLIICFLVGLNIVLGIYATTYHQRGVIDVMTFLRQQQESRISVPQEHMVNITVGFLMPCHSTPWRSHLIHRGISGWALTCEPPIDRSLSGYVDEADRFYTDPTQYVREEMEDPNEARKPRFGSTKRPWPEYLVFFEQMEPEMKTILRDTAYRERVRFFNTHWHDDRRRKGDVVVWQWESAATDA